MSRPVRARVILGHVLDALRLLPDRSVHCVVTSPPYWGLRDYGTAAWEGGDAACLHLRTEGPLGYGSGKSRWQHANNGLELAKALGMDAPGARPVTDDVRQRAINSAGGAVCLDCGAVRVEPTVWGGLPSCVCEEAERNESVRDLRRDNPAIHRESSETLRMAEGVFTEVRDPPSGKGGPMASAQSTEQLGPDEYELEGRREMGRAVQNDSGPAGDSGSGQARVHDGAPSRRPAEDRSPARTVGSRPPSQWAEDRQSPGEPRDRDEGDADGSGRLPELRPSVPGDIACPNCGGCRHEWREEVRYRTGGGAAHGPDGGFWEPGEANSERLREARWQVSAFCRACGAWRGALGLEPEFPMYVEHLVAVFAEVRRVLRDDGVVWLNMGDCYATGAGRVGTEPGGGEQGARWRGDIDRICDAKRGYRGGRPESPIARAGAMRAGAANTVDPKAREGMGPMTQPNRMIQPGLKPKDLVGMPWRVAFALQEAGWWLRADVVWSKPNPMPESVTDRPTRAHEYVFLLAKGERYFYDADAVREPFAEATFKRILQEGFDDQTGGPKDYGLTGVDPNRSARRGLENLAPKVRAEARDKTRETPHLGGRRQAPEPGEPDAFHPLGRNKRTVWTIPTEPFAEAHFATFPQALIHPMILAGTSEKGCCPKCGAPWERVTAAEGGTTGRDWNRHGRRAADLLIGNTIRAEGQDGTYRRYEVGWRSGCVCGAPPELGLRPDDVEFVLSPGRPDDEEWEEEDPSMFVGRAGFERPRHPDEAVRPITRYEQRKYAGQLRASPRRAEMEAEAGAEAFAHYLRTDRAGARPIPPDLLGSWAARGLIELVEFPDWDTPESAPATVLDPFAGSGTTLLVAAKNGRDSVGIELKEDYVRLILDRLAPLEADLVNPVTVTVERTAKDADGEGAGPA